MHKVEEAVKHLKSTYGSLDSAAKMWNLNPVEVHEALANAESGTSEHYVLRLLASFNPLPEEIKPKKKTKIIDVDLSLRDKQVDEAFNSVNVEENANSTIEQ